MYIELTFRNIRRSLRDYLIYFITLTLTAALMYAFLALGFSPDILALSENMTMLSTGILFMSVLAAFMCSFVIDYAIRFILERRKKEFALYELMGMEVETVRCLFLAENGLIGAGAFILGSLLGLGLSGLLRRTVERIFGGQYSYRVVFSAQALGLTLLLFVLMYGFGMFRAAKIIHRRRLIELLYGHQGNERRDLIPPRRRLFTALCALIFTATGGGLLFRALSAQNNTSILYLGGAALLCFTGIYQLHRQIPPLLYQAAMRSPRFKYHRENLFFLGQLGRRLQTAGRTMAVAAILLSVSLATMFIGLAMGAGYRANMSAYYPYDAGVAIDAPLTKDSMRPIIAFVDKICGVKDSVPYYLYTVPGEPIEALALSDYNHLRRILDLSPATLRADEFLVHCDTWNYLDDIRQALAERPALSIGGHTLKPAQTPILTEAMEQYQMAGTKGYALVLPDECTQLLAGEKIRLVMALHNQHAPQLKAKLNRFLNSGSWIPDVQYGQTLPERVTMSVTVKAWGLANSLAGFTVLSFCSMYLSIIFIILSCTVLAFEQLSAIDSKRKNYEIIDRLGVSPEVQRRLLRREISSLFFIPLCFPVLSAVLLMSGTQRLFGSFILQKGLIPLYGLITLAVFCALYFAYFTAALCLFRRIVLAK